MHWTSRLAVACVLLVALLGPYSLLYAVLRWQRVLVHGAWHNRHEHRTHHVIEANVPLLEAVFAPLGRAEVAVHQRLQP